MVSRERPLKWQSYYVRDLYLASECKNTSYVGWRLISLTGPSRLKIFLDDDTSGEAARLPKGSWCVPSWPFTNSMLTTWIQLYSSDQPSVPIAKFQRSRPDEMSGGVCRLLLNKTQCWRVCLAIKSISKSRTPRSRATRYCDMVVVLFGKGEERPCSNRQTFIA